MNRITSESGNLQGDAFGRKAFDQLGVSPTVHWTSVAVSKIQRDLKRLKETQRDPKRSNKIQRDQTIADSLWKAVAWCVKQTLSFAASPHRWPKTSKIRIIIDDGDDGRLDKMVKPQVSASRASANDSRFC